ncbi:MAG: DUF5668 domain-containing protein [Ferruginibacter sp.]
MEKIKNFRDKESSRIAGGLILVAVGTVLLLRNMDYDMPRWLFTWPMILILVGIYTGFKHNFRNNSWLIITAVGGFFLVNKFIPALGLESFFWPAVIIALGIVFIIRPTREWISQPTQLNKWESQPADALQDTINITTADSSNFLMIRSVFSGIKRNLISKNFLGGNISAVFGGVEIDLSQADFNGRAEIIFNVVFGGVELVIPPHWAVQNEIDGIFHGLDDKRSFNPSASINPNKVLVLKGSAIFGGIEIRSF